MRFKNFSLSIASFQKKKFHQKKWSLDKFQLMTKYLFFFYKLDIHNYLLIEILREMVLMKRIQNDYIDLILLLDPLLIYQLIFDIFLQWYFEFHYKHILEYIY